MYIQGWHRKNPLQRGSSTHINTNTTPLWHHVKWYPPRAYSLAELRELIVFLQKLHGENTELGQLPSNIKPEVLPHEPEECSPEIPDTNEDDDDSSPKCWLFNQTRIRCYPVAKKYPENRDGFLTYAVGIASKLNAQLHEPVSDREVAGICRSIVDWCLGAKFGSAKTIPSSTPTSTFARYLADCRWAGHVSVARKIARLEIGRATYYRRPEFYNKLFDELCVADHIQWIASQCAPAKALSHDYSFDEQRCSHRCRQQRLPLRRHPRPHILTRTPLTNSLPTTLLIKQSPTYEGDQQKVLNEARGPPS
jgi:hypothetical protein